MSDRKTYELLQGLGAPFAIRCKICDMMSYNLGDIEKRYCGNCRVFHDDIARNMKPDLVDLAEQQRAWEARSSGATTNAGGFDISTEAGFNAQQAAEREKRLAEPVRVGPMVDIGFLSGGVALPLILATGRAVAQIQQDADPVWFEPLMMWRCQLCKQWYPRVLAMCVSCRIKRSDPYPR